MSILTLSNNPLSNTQIKSKNRTRDHGEVFTHEREVNAMLDLVKPESERLDATFLEPACGTGNFLTEILTRKLNTAYRLAKNSVTNYERYAVKAIASIYGIELLGDNLAECHHRLFEIFYDNYLRIAGDKFNRDCLNTVHFLLHRNLLQGDALTLKQTNGEPILFSQWTFIKTNFIKRHDFIYEYLLADAQDLTSNAYGTFHESDKGESVFIPKSIQEYSPVHYLRLWETES